MMKIECWCIGKTDADYLKTGVALYEKRLTHYTAFDFVIFPDIKNGGAMTKEILKQKEGEAFLQKINKEDYLILLDENGQTYTSVQFAQYIEGKQSANLKKMIFLIGGAFGFSEEIKKRANHSITLSKMTFSHIMIRLFFAEQLYRAYTIIKNEKYHNE